MDAQDMDHIPEELKKDDVVDPEALDTDDDGSQSEDDVEVDMDDSDGMALYLCLMPVDSMCICSTDAYPSLVLTPPE